MRRANCHRNEFRAHQETNCSDLGLILGMTRLLYLSFENKYNKLYSTLSETSGSFTRHLSKQSFNIHFPEKMLPDP